MNGPRDDAFAALLGISVERRGAGHTVAVLDTDERHANPHHTVHGAVFYAVAGAAVAAAANDDESSGTSSTPRWRGRSRPAARTSSPGRSGAVPRATSWPGCAPAAPIGLAPPPP